MLDVVGREFQLSNAGANTVEEVRDFPDRLPDSQGGEPLGYQAIVGIDPEREPLPTWSEAGERRGGQVPQ
jgi:hypothetical protein